MLQRVNCYLNYMACNQYSILDGVSSENYI
jgi:hypothetical protein